MKYAIVIGLGNFGYYVSKYLAEKGIKVIAMDKRASKIECVKNIVTKAVIADSTSRETLESFGVRNADVVIVTIGTNMGDSILTIHLLKELNVNKIIAKANSEAHGKILDVIGADEVVFAEKDAAERVATKLSTQNVLDFLPLSDKFSIREIAPPEKFIGKTIKDLDLRKKYNIHIIAIKELIPSNEVILPTADFVIKESDSLIIAGEEKSLNKIPEL